jgi:hypothetical protein
MKDLKTFDPKKIDAQIISKLINIFSTGTDVMIFKYFRRKIQRKNWRS